MGDGTGTTIMNYDVMEIILKVKDGKIVNGG